MGKHCFNCGFNLALLPDDKVWDCESCEQSFCMNCALPAGKGYLAFFVDSTAFDSDCEEWLCDACVDITVKEYEKKKKDTTIKKNFYPFVYKCLTKQSATPVLKL